VGNGNAAALAGFSPFDPQPAFSGFFQAFETSSRPLSEEERSAMQAGKGIHCEYEPGTFRPKANKDNDYLIDRKAQKEKRSFSGSGLCGSRLVLAGKHGTDTELGKREAVADRPRDRDGAPDAL
jgi:hypothetical protein